MYVLDGKRRGPQTLREQRDEPDTSATQGTDP